MAMGVDEAGQQNNFAEVADFFALVRAQIFPRRDGLDFIARMKTAPSSMGGAVTGRIIFARRII